MIETLRKWWHTIITKTTKENDQPKIVGKIDLESVNLGLTGIPFNSNNMLNSTMKSRENKKELEKAQYYNKIISSIKSKDQSLFEALTLNADKPTLTYMFDRATLDGYNALSKVFFILAHETDICKTNEVETSAEKYTIGEFEDLEKQPKKEGTNKIIIESIVEGKRYKTDPNAVIDHRKTQHVPKVVCKIDLSKFPPKTKQDLK